jgi:AraC-like DNA-binding protein
VRKAGPGAPPPWSGPIEDHFWLHNVLRLYAGFNLWVIGWDGKRLVRWWQLTPPVTRAEPHHFEAARQGSRPRMAHQLACLKAVVASREPRLAEDGGFWDLVLPLPGEAGRHAVLFAGQFSRRIPRVEGLKAQWRALTGREGGDANPDFVAYVRAALSLPLLDDAVLRGMTLLLRDYASVLAGRPGAAGAHRRAQALRERILARHLPHPYWAAQALSPDKPRLAPWAARRELADYEEKELGIRRVPTTVLALAPVEPAGGAGVAEALVRGADLRRECFLIAKRLPETVPEALREHGMLFLTSPTPGRSSLKARQELRATAEAIRHELRRRLGLNCSVGIGGSVAPGEPLHPSHREALAALERCGFPRQSVLFFDESHAQSRPAAALGALQAASAELAQALLERSPEAFELALQGYAQAAQAAAAPRPDQVRARLLDMLMRLQEVLLAQGRLDAGENEALLEAARARLEVAADNAAAVAAFHDAALGLLKRGPRSGKGVAEVLRHLEQEFRGKAGLADMARRAGLSVSVFCQAFKAATGTSLVGHLQALRVAEAKRLLRRSQCTVDEVALRCGFNSTRHFQRTFQKITGCSPTAYRSAPAD